MTLVNKTLKDIVKKMIYRHKRSINYSFESAQLINLRHELWVSKFRYSQYSPISHSLLFSAKRPTTSLWLQKKREKYINWNIKLHYKNNKLNLKYWWVLSVPIFSHAISISNGNLNYSVQKHFIILKKKKPYQFFMVLFNFFIFIFFCVWDYTNHLSLILY